MRQGGAVSKGENVEIFITAVICLMIGAGLGTVIACLCITSGQSDVMSERHEQDKQNTGTE